MRGSIEIRPESTKMANPTSATYSHFGTVENMIRYVRYAMSSVAIWLEYVAKAEYIPETGVAPGDQASLTSDRRS